jgi:hypothetical protein
MAPDPIHPGEALEALRAALTQLRSLAAGASADPFYARSAEQVEDAGGFGMGGGEAIGVWDAAGARSAVAFAAAHGKGFALAGGPVRFRLALARSGEIGRKPGGRPSHVSIPEGYREDVERRGEAPGRSLGPNQAARNSE